MAEKVWFITGASSGFGRSWAEAALERGDCVAIAARDATALGELAKAYPERALPLALDVTDREAVFDRVAQAHAYFGRLDVVVNNAGYSQFGMIEELTEDELRGQFETNFFGTAWVSQATLPFLRSQGSGHLIQVSSIGGIKTFLQLGAYNSSKWAVEGLSQAIAEEVAAFGIKVTIVEPGGFGTGLAAAARQSKRSPDYEPVHAVADGRRSKRMQEPGTADSTVGTILNIVDAEKPPLRIFLGPGLLEQAKQEYEERIATWESWGKGSPVLNVGDPEQERGVGNDHRSI